MLKSCAVLYKVPFFVRGFSQMSDSGETPEPNYWSQRIEQTIREIVDSNAAARHSPEALRQHVLAALATIMSDPRAPKIRDGGGEDAANLLSLITKALDKFQVTKD